MKILFDLIGLCFGIGLLLKGADWLVEGSVSLARRLGLSPLIIGLTIVAMGTSAPETAASIAAALVGSGDIAVGNVYGSNIANLALIGGLCAVIRPIQVQRISLRRDMPFMIGTALLLWPFFVNGGIGRPAALLLIMIFIVLMAFMISSEKKRFSTVQEFSLEEKLFLQKVPKQLGISILFILLGLPALAFGAKLTIWGASSLGRQIGLSEAVIGLTIVAVGTSLPEMITSLVASFKKQDDLSIGNLVGSNIFNTLFVIGSAGLARPFSVSQRLLGMDYWIMVAVSILFACFAFARDKISRAAGMILLAIYAAYLIYLLSSNRIESL
ncbi:MAG TPA: calcium/sodium antiporter [Anaerohalosphaeraceae bacterium]|nr:calcium/sodium antiporter [Anaerohalosphaeraceae bacterium]